MSWCQGRHAAFVAGAAYGSAVVDFGEVVDRLLFAVDLELEVRTLQIGDAISCLVGDHHFDVHHPDVHDVAEERHGGLVLRQQQLSRQQGCNQGEDGGEKPIASTPVERANSR